MIRKLVEHIQEADIFKPVPPEELEKRREKRSKCPKCGKAYETLYVQQKFCTTITGEFDGDDYYFDKDAGYSDLYEWLNNMLTEDGEPEVVGCDKCL